MYIRLAFSVAVHLDADILLLDEVLMVGDLSFQKKSQEKMLSITQDGRTVVLVSHIMPMVRDLCTRVIWLQKGSILMDDTPSVVLDAYEKSVAPGSDKIRRTAGILVRGETE
jgi:ABC-2 type transport system ATP-binding protein